MDLYVLQAFGTPRAICLTSQENPAGNVGLEDISEKWVFQKKKTCVTNGNYRRLGFLESQICNCLMPSLGKQDSTCVLKEE